MGKKIAIKSIKGISRATIFRINQPVGFRLITKRGTTGVINLGKVVPMLGGIVGATFDSDTANIVGNVARDTFIASTKPVAA
ncbi:hypothetical protein [Paraburkholderia elongata]|uniref:Uncharacterized protein n=1 Tax=Paraburkholderia elongata TaxID=2675747 RepID=A0A972SM52_9BURK|nr:hypothetical protein [Paraburkholderia elongata]NPT58480.1 hypothetical protein [Paraburkholderia elongata]